MSISVLSNSTRPKASFHAPNKFHVLNILRGLAKLYNTDDNDLTSLIPFAKKKKSYIPYVHCCRRSTRCPPIDGFTVAVGPSLIRIYLYTLLSLRLYVTELFSVTFICLCLCTLYRKRIYYVYVRYHRDRRAVAHL